MDNKTARPSGSDQYASYKPCAPFQVPSGEQPWRYLDLSMAQLKAVMLLCRTGRARSRELADGLNIAPSAATPLVDRLVEQKLARRVDDDKDRRIVWIHPTAKAKAIYDELLEMNEQVLAEVIKEVPRANRKGGQSCIRLLADAAARCSRRTSKARLAERKGFEPLEPVKVQRFSRPPLSTAQPSSPARNYLTAVMSFLAAHERAQRVRDHDRSVLLLVVLEHRDQAFARPPGLTHSACARSSALPVPSGRNLMFARRAWNASQFEQEEISRYAFWLGSQTSMS